MLALISLINKDADHSWLFECTLMLNNSFAEHGWGVHAKEKKKIIELQTKDNRSKIPSLAAGSVY